MHYAPATTALTAVTALLTLAKADPLQNCVSGQICYTVAVPPASSSSTISNSSTGTDTGTNDLYIQLQAPTTYTWAALGQGTSMTGASIYVMYADGTGNVTLSPRTGTGHTQPQANPAAVQQLTLLAGSGIDPNTGLMVANVRCANCATSTASSDWIAAWKSGEALDSTDIAAPIQKHDEFTQFTFDLSQATVAQEGNPFVGAAAAAPVQTMGGAAAGANSSLPMVIAVHGVIMALLFVITFPMAALVMPILGKWKVHAIFQMVNFVLMWIGYGLGVYCANGLRIPMSAGHTLLGSIVCWALLIQPVLGWFHHKHFLKHKARGPISHAHIWYGRVLVIVGAINVGLGLQLAGANPMVFTFYIIAVASLAVLDASVKLFKFMMARNQAQMQQKNSGISFQVKDPRWEGSTSVHEVELNTYGIARGQQL